MLELLTPVAGWALGKVADTLWESGTDYVKATLSKPQLSQALKDSLVAVREWEKTLPTPKLLFFSCDERRAGQFLERVFVDAGVMEQLQQPLAQQGEPDRELLRRYFEAVAAETDTKIVATSLPDWLGVFCCAYFEKTALFVKYQLGRQRYLQQLVLRYDDVKFLGISVAGQEHEKSRKLLQIFVMPDVKARPAEGARRLAEREMAAGLDTRQAQLLTEQRQLSALLAQEGKTFSARELLGQEGSGRCVLLGAPGSGKTTLVSYFAVMLAQGEAQGEELAAAGLAADALPLVVRIREWVEKRELGLLEFAQWFAKTRLEMRELPAGFFEYWLEQGKALILLDGLDEVANEAHRDEVVNQIECFLQQEQYRQNPAIITSRPAGYKQAYFRTEEFAHYDLQPFDEEKIGQFIENWYDNRESDPEVSQRHQAELKRALAERDRIQLLAKNPLLLTIITLIHRYEAYLPRKRHQLYNRAVETLLTNWDANKDLRAWPLDYLKRDALRRLMERLAYWIHTQGSAGDSEGGTLIDRTELIDQLSDFIAEEAGIKPYEAKNEAERFLAHIRSRTGLLNEQGQDCYAFVHKTFQEYLAAEEINYQHKEEGFEVVERHLSQHLHTAHWEEVLLLLIAQQPKKRVAQLIQQILAHPAPYEQWLHRNLFFAAACLAEDVPLSDEKLVNRVLEPLVKMVDSKSPLISNRHRTKTLKSIRKLRATSFENAALTTLEGLSNQIHPVQLQRLRISLGQSHVAIQALIRLLQDTDYSVRYRAISMLVQINAKSEDILDALLRMLQDPTPDARSYAARALGYLGKESDTVLSILLNCLQDPDYDVRSNVVKALGQLGTGSDAVLCAFLELLQDPDYSVRSSIAEALGQLEIRPYSVLIALLTLLQDSEYDVRFSAVQALEGLKVEPQILFDALLQLLKSPEPYTRQSAASAVGQIGMYSNAMLSNLLELCHDPEHYVRSNAAETLGHMGLVSEDVLNTLLICLRDHNSDVRHSAVDALVQIAGESESVLSSLQYLLQDPDDCVRCSAASALSQLGDQSKAVISELLMLLQSQNAYIRSSAAYALGQCGISSELVVDALLKALEDFEFNVRCSSMEALDQLNVRSKALLNMLLKLIQDPDDLIRLRAAYILGRRGVGSETVISTLLKLLQHSEITVRSNAALTLGQIEMGSKSIISALLQLLSDPNSSVRSRAVEALGKVGRQTLGAAERVADWVEQHQGNEFVGEGVDVLWQLVTEQA